MKMRTGPRLPIDDPGRLGVSEQFYRHRILENMHTLLELGRGWWIVGERDDPLDMRSRK